MGPEGTGRATPGPLISTCPVVAAVVRIICCIIIGCVSTAVTVTVLLLSK